MNEPVPNPPPPRPVEPTGMTLTDGVVVVAGAAAALTLLRDWPQFWMPRWINRLDQVHRVLLGLGAAVAAGAAWRVVRYRRRPYAGEWSALLAAVAMVVAALPDVGVIPDRHASRVIVVSGVRVSEQEHRWSVLGPALCVGLVALAGALVWPKRMPPSGGAAALCIAAAFALWGVFPVLDLWLFGDERPRGVGDVLGFILFGVPAALALATALRRRPRPWTARAGLVIALIAGPCWLVVNVAAAIDGDPRSFFPTVAEGSDRILTITAVKLAVAAAVILGVVLAARGIQIREDSPNGR